RKTSSRLIECPFALRDQKKSNLWVLSISNSNHEYDPSEDPSAHLSLRRLNQQSLEQLRNDYLKGKTPIQAILDDLKEGIVNSNTEEDFATRWQELNITYSRNLPTINYLQNIWLLFKDRFVHAWTDRYLHLGNTVTSRNQYNKIKTMVAKEKTQIPHELNIPFYRELINKVSSFALRKVYEQFTKVLSATPANSLPPCTGQPTGSQKDIQSSTRRNSSAFELKNLKMTGRKCSIYYNVGHNSRTCPDRN
ncbi:1971_t:CDS:2, partial [Racocetra persica]